jgi:outer membrane protein TolC
VEATAEEEGQIDNPQIRIQNIRLDRLVNNQPRVDVALRVTPPRPGEVGARMAVARAEGSAARAEARFEEQAAEAEVRFLFVNVLLFDAEIEAATAAAEAQKRLHGIIKARMEQAQATRVDEASAELASKEADYDREELKADRGAAYGALLDRIGLPANADVRLIGDPLDLERLPELPSEDAFIAAALKARPEIAAAAALVDAADASIYLEKTQQWPWLSFVQLGYSFAPDIQEGLGWTFGAGVEIPVFSVNRGAILRAEADRAAAEAALKGAVEGVVIEVRDRLREARAARDVAIAYARDAGPAAARAAEAAKAALNAAQVDATEMELIEERRFKMIMRKLKLLRRYHEAALALTAAAAGKPAPGPSDQRR